MDSPKRDLALQILLQLLEEVREVLDKDMTADVVYVEVTKAFDKGPHIILGRRWKRTESEEIYCDG